MIVRVGLDCEPIDADVAEDEFVARPESMVSLAVVMLAFVIILEAIVVAAAESVTSVAVVILVAIVGCS